MGVAALVASGCEDDGPTTTPNDPVTGAGGASGSNGAGGSGGLGSATGEGSAGTGTNAGPQVCTLNCCDGTLQPLADDYAAAADLCESAAASEAGCDAHGGAANVFWGDKLVWQDLSCEGNCHVNCCDGTAAFSSTSGQGDCEIGALESCGEASGGPSTVAWDSVLAWTANADCPSLRPCTLRCVDGMESTGSHYQAALCVHATVESALCEGHGGPDTVSFDGAQVWP